VDNIQVDLGEREWGGMDWIGLPKDQNQRMALVNAIMNLRVP
jgi:hypothetical protein